LVRLASEVLVHRSELNVTFAEAGKADALREILRVGTSAGGARAKAIIAWNPATNEVRSGQVTADEGFSYWLMKFDGVQNNKDHELADPQGYGAIEFIIKWRFKPASTWQNAAFSKEGLGATS
jgi:serine/threonine-protein kinase HipA